MWLGCVKTSGKLISGSLYPSFNHSMTEAGACNVLIQKPKDFLVFLVHPGIYFQRFMFIFPTLAYHRIPGGLVLGLALQDCHRPCYLLVGGLHLWDGFCQQGHLQTCHHLLE